MSYTQSLTSGYLVLFQSFATINNPLKNYHSFAQPRYILGVKCQIRDEICHFCKYCQVSSVKVESISNLCCFLQFKRISVSSHLCQHSDLKQNLLFSNINQSRRNNIMNHLYLSPSFSNYQCMANLVLIIPPYTLSLTSYLFISNFIK